MKKYLLALAAVASLSGAASAATYAVDVTANPYRSTPTTNGLQTRAIVLQASGPQEFLGSTISISLNNIGDSVTTDLFLLAAFDAPLDPDDLLPRPTTASFDFGGAIGALTINGLSKAIGGGTTGYAIATYVSDIIRVSATEGIRISLADTIFGTDGNGNFVMGRAGAGSVTATFELAAVPVPAALPLSVTALALMGFVASRRKSRKVA